MSPGILQVCNYDNPLLPNDFPSNARDRMHPHPRGTTSPGTKSADSSLELSIYVCKLITRPPRVDVSVGVETEGRSTHAEEKKAIIHFPPLTGVNPGKPTTRDAITRELTSTRGVIYTGRDSVLPSHIPLDDTFTYISCGSQECLRIDDGNTLECLERTWEKPTRGLFGTGPVGTKRPVPFS